MVIVDRRTVLTVSFRSELLVPTLPVFDPTAPTEDRLLLRWRSVLLRPLLTASVHQLPALSFASAAPAMSHPTPPARRKIKRPVSGSPG